MDETRESDECSSDSFYLEILKNYKLALAFKKA